MVSKPGLVQHIKIQTGKLGNHSYAMILSRCKDKSDLDKTDFIIVWEKEILRPTDQTSIIFLKTVYLGQKSLEI